MGDHSNEMSLEKRVSLQNENIARCRRLLGKANPGPYLFLSGETIPFILNNIDCFVSQSRGNRIIEEMFLHPYSLDGQDDDAWDKFGQAIGNLQVLKDLHISTHNCYHEEEEDKAYPTHHWEILARLLSHVRQRITLTVIPHEIYLSAWRAEDSRSLARAIRGHPTITRFEDISGMFPFESLDVLYSALATLPALEAIVLSKCRLSTRPEDESSSVNPKILTDLLRVPTLRFVCFHRFHFTRALCQAAATALTEGSAIASLEFTECSFPAGECALMMANGLSRNTSVSHIKIVSSLDQGLCDALATALHLNSTLRQLLLKVPPSGDDTGAHIDWSPIFLALGENKGLKILNADVPYSMDESLCTAMQNGLGINEALESLELNSVSLCLDNADLICRSLSFLRANRALKSLTIRLMDMTNQCVPAFCIDIAAMLQDNTSLESLTVQSWGNIKIKAEEYLVLITTLQHNQTLKSLNLEGRGILTLTDDEDKQIAALLQKNYALENLPNINLEIEAGDVGAILRLNESGRRYLIEDGSSISKGVKVLSAVSNEINCVFLHLLENPRLCDRSAVEAASDITDNGGSTSPVDPIGKREHSRVQNKGKESRRRLT